MSRKDFEYWLNKKIESGTLYTRSFSQRIVCGNCDYRGARTNTCRKFNCSIVRIHQYNGGYHHVPCDPCLKYELTTQDINYFRMRHNRKRYKFRSI